MEFYRSLSLPDNVFPNLKKFASKMASMYWTTYICEQTFSKMKYVKSYHRTRLTDDHLKAILMVGCCTSEPNVDDIMRENDNFINPPSSDNFAISAYIALPSFGKTHYLLFCTFRENQVLVFRFF